MIMTPFGEDFLSQRPAWLHPTDKKPTAVTAKTDDAMTLVQSAVAAVPNLLITMAVLSAFSFGPGPTTQPHATGGNVVASLVAAPLASPVDRAWDGYLSRLEAGRFAQAHIAAVRTVWDHFRKVNAKLTPPQTAPTAEGALTMVWDAGAHHLEVDVEPTRKVGWFYTNRETGKVESGEGSLAGHLPLRLDEHVKRIV